MHYIGIDLGGTSIKGAVVTEGGTILKEASCPTQRESGPEHVAREIAGLITALAEGYDPQAIGGVGVGCPGIVEDHSGIVRYSANLHWENFDLRAAVQKYSGYTVRLANDANAAALGEVPVGAVVARNGEIIAAAHNTRETEKNALHHAELLAIDAACKKLGGWRLWQCELFVTLEPCPMCSGGIINSRIRRVVYGAADTKAGCCGSVTDLFALPFNHHPVVESGLRAEEAQALLQAFFLRLREQRAAKPRWKPPVTP